MGINQYPTKYISDIDVVVSGTAPATPEVGDIWVDTSTEVSSLDVLSTKVAGPNILHNGAFNVNQRGFSSTTTQGAYGFDRWRLACNIGTTTYSAQTFDSGTTVGAAPIYQPKSYTRIVSTGQGTDANAYSILIQPIESVRVAAGETVTASFWARSASGTPKIALEFEQYFGSGGSPSSTVQSCAGQVTLNTNWTRYSITFTLPTIVGKVLGSTDDGFLGFNLWTSAGSNFNTRTNSLGVQSATIDLWGIQLETGSKATTFEVKDYATELRECQKYYYRHATGNQPIGPAFFYTASSMYAWIAFPVTMRIGPSIHSSTGTDYYLLDRLGSVDYFNSFGQGSKTTAGSWVYNNTEITSSTAGATGLVQGYNASSYLGFTADL